MEYRQQTYLSSLRLYVWEKWASHFLSSCESNLWLEHTSSSQNLTIWSFMLTHLLVLHRIVLVEELSSGLAAIQPSFVFCNVRSSLPTLICLMQSRLQKQSAPKKTFILASTWNEGSANFILDGICRPYLLILLFGNGPVISGIIRHVNLNL